MGVLKINNLYHSISSISRKDREDLLKQRGYVFWFMGLSGSGKSTIADQVQNSLFEKGILTYILDGDNIRLDLNKDLDFTVSDREENIRRVCEVAKLMVDVGIVVLCSFITPNDKLQSLVKSLLVDDCSLIYVEADLESCISRDPKGLYDKAMKGQIKNFTGISQGYSYNIHDFVVSTVGISKKQSVFEVLQYINRTLNLKEKLEITKSIAMEAGRKILEIYGNSSEYVIKDDSSPLTIADLASNKIIVDELKKRYPNIPIISEEQSNLVNDKTNSFVWIIDPLDGTKEFINKNGEFTVNIALVYNHEPILGVIYSPVLDKLYFATKNNGAYLLENGYTKQILTSAKIEDLYMVGSRSHSDERERLILDEKKAMIKEYMVVGSSLKGAFIAEGKADIYYRFGYVSEWDICAMDIIVSEAGGILKLMNHEKINYNSSTPLIKEGFYVVNRKENIFV
jgi:3'(2'), 5'-bisphosphate nucleotidase